MTVASLADTLVIIAAVLVTIAIVFTFASFVADRMGYYIRIFDEPANVVIFLLVLAALIGATGELLQPGVVSGIRHMR